MHLNTIKKVKLELKSMLNYNSKLTNVVLDKPAFILISYCYWIISMSNRMKIKKLYFLARDGQILKKISEILIKKLNYNIKCEYLYVSRQSLRICNLDLNNETDLKWLLKNSKDVPLTKDLLLKRLALSMTDILNSKFNQYKIDNTSPKKQFKAFLKDSTVRKIINEHVKKERKIALEYFEKKGLFNSENYAFVDVGWQGRIPLMLRSMLDKSQLQFFYMGNLNPNKVFDIQIYSWLFDNENHLERTSFFDNTCATDLLEVITSADHETLLHYGQLKVGDPIDNKDTDLLNWGIEEYHDILLKYADSILLELYKLESYNDIIKEISFQKIKKLILNPTLNEAKIFGNFRYSSEQTNSFKQFLGEKMTVIKTLQLLKLQRGQRKSYPAIWQQGSLKQSSPMVRLLWKNIR